MRAGEGAALRVIAFFETKLEALDQVNRYLKDMLEPEDGEARAGRCA
ncbi:hypothetical protein [Cupriavidus sp. 8B]